MYKEEQTPAYTIMQEIKKLKIKVEALERAIPSGVVTTDIVEEDNDYPVTSGGVFNKITEVTEEIDNDKMDKMIIDTVPTANSQHLVTSGGVKAAIDGHISETLPLYLHFVRLSFTNQGQNAVGEINFSFLSTSTSNTTEYESLKILIKKSLKNGGPYYISFPCSGYIYNLYNGAIHEGYLRNLTYFDFAGVLQVYYYSTSPAFSGEHLQEFDLSSTSTTIHEHYVSDNILKEVL